MPTTADLRTGELPLRALLARVGERHPFLAERAARELDSTLAGLRDSAIGDLAWAASCLTPTRYPVEVAFTSVRAELRTVVDVIAPEADRREAMDAALALARRFGADGLAPGRVALLRRHQVGGRLRYGAWLGSRHTTTATRHKLYVETSPDQAEAWRLVDGLAPAARRVLGGVGPIRLIGLPLDGGDAVEVYVRPPDLGPDDVSSCLARAGLAHAATGLVRALSGGDPRGPFGRNHALSASFADGRVTAVAGFTFAHQRHRRDHRVRREVLARARRERWESLDLYAAASAPLADPAPMLRPVHTALSEVALESGHLEHHVGLAPPASGAHHMSGGDRPNAHPRKETGP